MVTDELGKTESRISPVRTYPGVIPLGFIAAVYGSLVTAQLTPDQQCLVLAEDEPRGGRS